MTSITNFQSCIQYYMQGLDTFKFAEDHVIILSSVVVSLYAA